MKVAICRGRPLAKNVIDMAYSEVGKFVWVWVWIRDGETDDDAEPFVKVQKVMRLVYDRPVASDAGTVNLQVALKDAIHDERPLAKTTSNRCSCTPTAPSPCGFGSV